jgi:hypothetical protein
MGKNAKTGKKNKGGRNKRPPLAHQRAFLHVRAMYETVERSEIALNRAIGSIGENDAAEAGFGGKGEG